MLLSPQTVELKAQWCSYVNMAGNERTRKSDWREWGTSIRVKVKVKGNPEFLGAKRAACSSSPLPFSINEMVEARP